MGYDKDVLQRARSRYAEAVESHRALQRSQREEICEELPEAAELERKLQATMAEVIAHSLRRGEDPTQAISAIRRRNRDLQEELHYLLEENGYDADALDEKPLCSRCRDTGYVGAEMCSCLKQYCCEEQKRELTSLLSTNATFDDFSLDYYPTTVNPATGLSPREQMEFNYESCVEYARHFRPGPGRNLLMNGAPGLGKTFLSACIAREVVDRGYSVVYDTAIHVFSCMEKQKFGGGTEEELRMAERVLECDLLILDDLGTEMNTSFISPALYSVINSRILSEKPTIISTNFTLHQLSQRYTPQIASRLDGEYRILVFAGNDIRKLKKEQY
ncbi:MAG: ATP-binding protein [Oscillospiraceae bacterium]|nr:ATP-binding protein [Oscillospiraceae bacterium]